MLRSLRSSTQQCGASNKSMLCPTVPVQKTFSIVPRKAAGHANHRAPGRPQRGTSASFMVTASSSLPVTQQTGAPTSSVQLSAFVASGWRELDASPDPAQKVFAIDVDNFGADGNDVVEIRATGREADVMQGLSLKQHISVTGRLACPRMGRPYIFAQSIRPLDNNGVGQGGRQQGQWQPRAGGAGGGAGGAPRVDRAERRAAEAGLWEALRANPNAWYDNRATKTGRQPDFKHKTDRNQALWVESYNKPDWVDAFLAGWEPRRP